MKKIVSIFHHNDLDGYGSAAEVFNYVRKIEAAENNMAIFNFFECSYKGNRAIEPNRAYIDNKVEKYDQKECYVVDISLSKESDLKDLLDLIKVYKYDKVIWIDHHKSSIDLLSTIKLRDNTLYTKYVDSGKLITIINNKRSGAYLTYRYFTGPRSKIPTAIKYIDDYDRWIHKYPESRLLNNSFFGMKELHMVNSIIWSALVDPYLSETALNDSVLKTGRIISNYLEMQNSAVINNYLYVSVLEGNVCCVINKKGNSDMFGSFYDDTPLCATWTFNGKEYTYTLYSNPKFKIDCSEIAKKYGGGGHKGAAGFRYKEFLLAPVESLDKYKK